MTKLAKLIAQEEGFFVTGSLPQRNNNPGDLRHSPNSQHSIDSPNAIGKIDTILHGWEDLERQLRLDAHISLSDFVKIYAPPSENNTNQYLDFLCRNLPASPNDSVGAFLNDLD